MCINPTWGKWEIGHFSGLCHIRLLEASCISFSRGNTNDQFRSFSWVRNLEALSSKRWPVQTFPGSVVLELLWGGPTRERWVMPQIAVQIVLMITGAAGYNLSASERQTLLLLTDQGILASRCQFGSKSALVLNLWTSQTMLGFNIL